MNRFGWQLLSEDVWLQLWLLRSSTKVSTVVTQVVLFPAVSVSWDSCSAVLRIRKPVKSTLISRLSSLPIDTPSLLMSCVIWVQTSSIDSLSRKACNQSIRTISMLTSTTLGRQLWALLELMVFLTFHRLVMSCVLKLLFAFPWDSLLLWILKQLRNLLCAFSLKTLLTALRWLLQTLSKCLDGTALLSQSSCQTALKKQVKLITTSLRFPWDKAVPFLWWALWTDYSLNLNSWLLVFSDPNRTHMDPTNLFTFLSPRSWFAQWHRFCLKPMNTSRLDVRLE